MATNRDGRQALSTPGQVAGLALSTLAVGAVLYALTSVTGPATASRNGIAGALLVGWCYCDGAIGQLHWGLAVLEGLARLRLALAWTALLLDTFPRSG